jgi:dolichol kinase
MTSRKQISYANELARKSIHVTSVFIPIVYLLIGRSAGVTTLMCMTVVSVIIDVAMYGNARFRSFMYHLVGTMLRDHEKHPSSLRLTGASWVLIAATLTFIVFPQSIAVTCFTILIISDTVAALLGRRFGVRRFFDKSLVGSAAFIVAGWAVVYAWGSVFRMPVGFYVCGAVAAIVGAVAEASSARLRLDDNIAVPVASGIAMFVVSLFHPVLTFPQSY